MIVTPEGLNVFPEDVERVLNQIAGVRDSAVVGVPIGSEERRARGARARAGAATTRTRSSGRPTRRSTITRRSAAPLVWPEAELPRTEGTRKLKRAAIRDWVKSGGAAPRLAAAGRRRARSAGRQVRRTHRSVRADDARGAGAELARSRRADGRARRRVSDAHRRGRVLGSAGHRAAARARRARGDERAPRPPNRSTFRPGTGRGGRARFAACNLPTWILPLARVFAWLRVEGREHLRDLDGPVIFAANHQSFMDGAGDHGGAAAAVALPARAGDGQGVVHGAFLSRAARTRARGSPTA